MVAVEQSLSPWERKAQNRNFLELLLSVSIRKEQTNHSFLPSDEYPVSLSPPSLFQTLPAGEMTCRTQPLKGGLDAVMFLGFGVPIVLPSALKLHLVMV